MGWDTRSCESLISYTYTDLLYLGWVVGDVMALVLVYDQVMLPQLDHQVLPNTRGGPVCRHKIPPCMFTIV